MLLRFAIAFLILCRLLAGDPAAAQTPSAQGGLSERQFDAIVGAVTEAVRRELAASGQAAPAPVPAPAIAATPPATDWRERVRVVASAAPRMPGAVVDAVWRLVAAGGERPLARLATGVALALALQLAVGVALWVAIGRWRRDMLAPARKLGHAWRVGVLAVADVALRAGVLVAAMVGGAVWFGADDGFAALGRAIVELPAWWWMILTLPKIVLRPGDAAHRLVPLGDRVAAAVHLAIAVLLAPRLTMVHVLPILIVKGALPVPEAQAFAIVVGGAIFLGALAAGLPIWRRDRADRRSLAAAGEPIGLARRAWPVMVLCTVGSLWFAWTLGTFAVDLSLYDSLVEIIAVVLVAIVVDRIIALLEAERAVGAARGDAVLALLLALRRCARLAAAVVVAVVGLRVLAVEHLALVQARSWDQVLPALRTATIALILGYAAWEMLRFWVDRRLGPQVASRPGEDEEVETARTRFDTLLPLLRITGGLAIGVVTVLFALTELGVNTTPLLAGASIFGLAISFGSQSLVRDIVSGVFFMLDDAFRIGDYIDSGRLKGTVEGISLRSVRLRHQNGQVHTIPFGQLQSITNFSRDWATMKFNLRLARDSDVEAVRKAVKKIGQEMLADPELAREFIQPLKLQGVQEIDETAIVVRCKFTVRPAKPTWVQRQALRRIHDAFPRLGIQFASPNITVHGATSEAVAHEAAAQAHAAARRADPKPSPA